MIKAVTAILLSVICLAQPLACQASEALPALWSAHSKQVELSRFVEYWQEPAGDEVAIDRVKSLPDSAWTRNGGDSVNLGYGDAVYWFRVRIRNGTEQPAEPFLEIGYPVLDRIEVFAPTSVSRDLPVVMGDKQPFYERPIDHRNFVLPVSLAPETDTFVYLRVATTSSMQVPLTLWRPDAFYSAEQSRGLFEGLYYGIVLVMILYNLFVYLAVGERSFLHYVGYITAMPLFLASLHGMAFQYFWPNATWWNDQSILFFLNLVIVFGGTFSIRFINVTRQEHPYLNRLAIVMVTVAALLAGCALFVPYKDLIVPTIVVAALGCSTMLLLSVVRWMKREPAARYYTMAWVFMLFGGIVLALSKFTLLPRNMFTENATQVGSALGVILLSIALADRLDREKRRAFESQQRLLLEERKTRIAQEKSLRVQQEANVLLEQRVKERTLDLEKLNQQLLELNATDALTGLKNRGHFDEAFRSAVVHAFRYQQPLSLVVLDIDHFKHFNDTYGHLVGDDCLKMVAACVQRFATRPGDLAARYGGEEFVVVLPETPDVGATRVAERIRQEVEKTPFRVSGDTVHVTVSIGVCTALPAKADATKEIFHCADEALYEAKGRGRNRVVTGTQNVAITLPKT